MTCRDILGMSHIYSTLICNYEVFFCIVEILIMIDHSCTEGELHKIVKAMIKNVSKSNRRALIVVAE